MPSTGDIDRIKCKMTETHTRIRRVILEYYYTEYVLNNDAVFCFITRPNGISIKTYEFYVLKTQTDLSNFTMFLLYFTRITHRRRSY